MNKIISPRSEKFLPQKRLLPKRYQIAVRKAFCYAFSSVTRLPLSDNVIRNTVVIQFMRRNIAAVFPFHRVIVHKHLIKNICILQL